MKLKGHRIIRGTIVCNTGLRIGGTKDDFEIGGMDNPMIRHPLTGFPYIPGSSLKGKLRSVLELKYGKFQPNGEPCRCAEPSCPVCRLFGPHKAPNHDLGPTRLIVRDALLTPESEATLLSAQQEKGVNFAEIKTENWIDRRTGRAGNTGLRTQERVPAGTEFRFEMVVRVFDADDAQELLARVFEGLSLLQREYLGGSGSRGYGKVTFRNVTVDGEPREVC